MPIRQFPRNHRPGTFHGSGRTTRENEELLHPHRRDDNGYAIAEAADYTDMRLSVALVVPDGVQYLSLDTTGDLSDFWQRCHRTLSAMQQRRLGLVDTIWSSDPPQSMVIEGWEYTKARIVELASSLVASGRCDHPSEHPGWYGPDWWGREVEFARPDTFADRSLLPATATMMLQPPPDRPHDDLPRLIREVNDEIEDALGAARKIAAALRRDRRRRRTTSRKSRVVRLEGRALRAAKRNDRPHSLDYFGPDRAQWRRRRKKFVADYEKAKSRFRRNRNVCFPTGTVGFRKLGANCAPFARYTPPPLLAQPP